MSKKQPQTYEVITGISYGKDKRAEPGTLVSDLPAASISWLLEQGHIKPANESEAR